MDFSDRETVPDGARPHSQYLTPRVHTSTPSNPDVLAEKRSRGIEGCVFHFASSSVES